MYSLESQSRFLCKARVDFFTGCWVWQGYVDKLGYGQFGIRDGVKELAHRFSYVMHCGPIPSGLVIDHVCCNKSCVNPMHLEAVTQKENIHRYHRGREVCRNGHPRGSSYVSRGGHTRCKICRGERSKR